jgi:hypothetical protein
MYSDYSFGNIFMRGVAVAMLVSHFALSSGCISNPSVINVDEAIGVWKVDNEATREWYIEHGTPWHMWEEEVRAGNYRNFRMEIGSQSICMEYPKIEIADTMRYDIVPEYQSSSRILFRIYPSNDLRKLNDLSKEGILKKVIFPGDRLYPYIGVRFLNKDKIMIFHLVLGKQRSIEMKDSGLICNRGNVGSAIKGGENVGVIH